MIKPWSPEIEAEEQRKAKECFESEGGHDFNVSQDKGWGPTGGVSLECNKCGFIWRVEDV